MDAVQKAKEESMVRLIFGKYTGQRSAALFMALAVCGALALSACGSQAPDASSLIHDGQKAINTDKAFHFKMKLDHPGTGSAASISIDAADGDVQRPDKAKGTATVSQGGAAIDVQFIGIGKQQYALTPLSPSWMPVNLGINLGQLLDPKAGVGAILGAMQNPKNIGDDTVLNDGDCWLVEGTVPAGALAPITGGDPTATTPLDTTVCIAKNLDAQGLRQPYQIVLKGIAADGDTAQTTRTFTLTKFNESIDIEPPPQQ
jgi:hypothetical protein